MKDGSKESKSTARFSAWLHKECQNAVKNQELDLKGWYDDGFRDAIKQRKSHENLRDRLLKENYDAYKKGYQAGRKSQRKEPVHPAIKVLRSIS